MLPPTPTRSLALAVLLLTTAGCYGWRPVDAGPEAVIQQIRPAELRARMVDGRVVTVRNPQLVNDTIVGASRTGEPRRAPASDLASLEVRRFSTWRTVALVGAHAVTFAGIIAAVIYIQPHYSGF